MPTTRTLLRALCLSAAVAAPALGWSAHGHRTITYLALDGLPADAPAWLRESPYRQRIADEANQPDRWRGTRLPALSHVNNPDHYIDLEKLPQFGLTLESVPHLRNQYVAAMAVAKHTHPERVAPYDSKADASGESEYPGFLPYAIAEHYAKLRASFNDLRILETLADPARADQLEIARLNVVYHLGMLSHFVGDAAQPLHTTSHHHGWVGDNPNGYSTDKRIHAYIDGDVVDVHHLGYDSLRPSLTFGVSVDRNDPWADMVVYINRSHDHVEPLYRLEKQGLLPQEEGRAFITERLIDAAVTLAAMYSAAWTSSEPTEQEISAWVRYSNLKPTTPPKATAAPGAAEPPAPAAGAAPSTRKGGPRRGVRTLGVLRRRRGSKR